MQFYSIFQSLGELLDMDVSTTSAISYHEKKLAQLNSNINKCINASLTCSIPATSLLPLWYAILPISVN